MTKAISIFSCVNELHKIAIIRWTIGCQFLLLPQEGWNMVQRNSSQTIGRPLGVSSGKYSLVGAFRVSVAEQHSLSRVRMTPHRVSSQPALPAAHLRREQGARICLDRSRGRRRCLQRRRRGRDQCRRCRDEQPRAPGPYRHSCCLFLRPVY